jgi:VanZ family protein
MGALLLPALIRVQPTPFSAWLRWAAVAGYMVAIFVVSAGPGPALPPGQHVDKVLHAGAYALLAGLWAWALARGRLRDASWRTLLAAWAIASAYGATDELHQLFVPGRQADVFDFASDALGAAAAAGAVWAWGIIARGSE